MVVAIVALVFAMAGTGIAASRYLITSSSQIKPSVIQDIREGPVASAAAKENKPAAKGARALRAAAQLAGQPVPTGRKVRGRARKRLALPAAETSTEPTWKEVPLAGATWTQYPGEFNEMFGEITVERPTEAECPNSRADVQVTIDGGETEWGEVSISPYPQGGQTREFTGVVTWGGETAEGPTWWLFPGAASVERQLKLRTFEYQFQNGETAPIISECPEGSHYKVKSVTLEAFGLR